MIKEVFQLFRYLIIIFGYGGVGIIPNL